MMVTIMIIVNDSDDHDFVEIKRAIMRMNVNNTYLIMRANMMC
jgi:hypothetical protein